ncbi:hypothetical protein Arcpr_1091 [Archaeoglobus profundus DSM 5631]|uniref:Uncharacterized protein n=1 Tax=Archaeoglobus profundus (strain DSM 5631 / JCM 9629 / NBRC 100127 / Av18) TaxID=572546 RepID=D2RDF6_ARCPA|nr:hypothetical protein Arcpr_1091 [Archaeoglobus profundus DSM 5631]
MQSKMKKKGNLVIVNASDGRNLGYSFIYPVEFDQHTIVLKLGEVQRKITNEK